MSILISQNLTVNTTPGDLANRPLILVENVFQLGTVTASSEVGADNGWLENAVDGMTYDWWEWSALPATLEVTLSTAYPVDMCAIGLHTGITFVFQYWDGSAWVNLHEAVTTTTTAVHAVVFTEVTASRFRINVTAVDDENILGLVMLGKAIQLPKTFYGGHAPITLNRTTQLVRNRTENGFDAGVYSLRTGAATSIEISNMKPAWIRNNLESLNKQLEIRPFVFAWRPETFPNDVAYCWLNSPIKAENSGPRDLMSMSFDVQAFVGGGIVAPILEYYLVSLLQEPWVTFISDDEQAVTYESSPATGFTGQVNNWGLSANKNGIVALAAGTNGARVWEYLRGEWTLVQSSFDSITDCGHASLHPDQAKWLLLNQESGPETVLLYKRRTLPSGASSFALESTFENLGSGADNISFAFFSPDGEIITRCRTTTITNYSFNVETGGYSEIETISIGQFTRCAVWDRTSTYLAVINDSTFGGVKLLKIFKRTGSTLSSLTVNNDLAGVIGINNLGNFADWSADSNELVIGKDDGTLVVYQNNGLDAFDDLTVSLLDGQPGVGGRIYSVKYNRAGDRCIIGAHGSSNGFVVYSVIDGVLTKLYTDKSSTNVFDIEHVRLSSGINPIPASGEGAL